MLDFHQQSTNEIPIHPVILRSTVIILFDALLNIIHISVMCIISHLWGASEGTDIASTSSHSGIIHQFEQVNIFHIRCYKYSGLKFSSFGSSASNRYCIQIQMYRSTLYLMLEPVLGFQHLQSSFISRIVNYEK